MGRSSPRASITSPRYMYISDKKENKGVVIKVIGDILAKVRTQIRRVALVANNVASRLARAANPSFARRVPRASALDLLPLIIAPASITPSVAKADSHRPISYMA